MEYRTQDIGKLLDELEGKDRSVLTQDVGALMKRAAAAASWDVSALVRDIASSSAEGGGPANLNYFIEFVKVDDGASGDMWNFYALAGKEGSGKFYRMGNVASKIVIEKKGPELLRLKRKLAALKKRGRSEAEAVELETRIRSNALRVKKVPRRDFERLFKTRNPLTAFAEEHFMHLQGYIAGIQRVRGITGDWIEIGFSDETEGFVLITHELRRGELEPAKTYALSHLREKDDYKVVYGVYNKNAVALFRMYDEGNRFAINDNIIPPGVNAILLKSGGIPA